MRLTLILFLGVLPYLTACDEVDSKTNDPQVSPTLEIGDPIEQIEESLVTIKKTKKAILDKQSEFSSKKTEFKKLITEIKHELLQETDAHRINNRLKNISEYDAYLQEIERRLVIMNPVPDKLLSYERSFEAKLKMVSIMDKAQLTDLKNQLTLIQKNLGNSLEELVIDESQIQRKSIDEIREELQREKYQKKKDERIAKEKQQKLKDDKRKKEEEDAQALIDRQKELEEVQRIKDAKNAQALIDRQKKLEEEQRIKDAKNAKQKLNSQIEQEFCDGIFTRSSQLMIFSYKASKCIGNYYPSSRLELNSVTSFEEYIYQGINTSMNSRCTNCPEIKKLFFNGLTNLSYLEIEEFVQFDKITELHLNGVKTISRYAAQKLQKVSFTLHLNGLEKVSVDEGVYLAEMPNLVVTDSIKEKLKHFKGEKTNNRNKSSKKTIKDFF